MRCVVCGGAERRILIPARRMAAEQRYLRLFHRRRLEPMTDGADAALEERARFTQDYATNLVLCCGCGLIFRDPRPAAEEVTRTYAQDHYDPGRLESIYKSQVALYRDRVRELQRWLPADRRPLVVEVGSFLGGFLTTAGEQGWQVLGVDPGEQVDEFCRQRDLPVTQGTLEDLPLPPASLDCVAIWNTFDQLPSPRRTLSAARCLIRPGGVLALRVPSGALLRLVTRLEGHLPRRLAAAVRAALAWNSLLGFPYLYGYSPDTLDRLVGQFGFRRLQIVPDTLGVQSDRQTRPWAALEERVLKQLCRLAARALPWGGCYPLAPWFDAFYRLEDRSTAHYDSGPGPALGLSP